MVRTNKTALGRRGPAVRMAVLEATFDELVERGIEGFSVAAVASRAGVHESSVYRRWNTREDLIVDALLARSAAEIPMPDTGSVHRDLVELAGLLSRYLSSPLGSALARMSALAVEDESLARARADFIASRFSAMRVVIDRAIDRGELPPHADARLALEMLVAPLHVRTILSGEPLTDNLPEQLVDILLEGLRRRT